jgi:hypothetical protein
MHGAPGGTAAKAGGARGAAEPIDCARGLVRGRVRVRVDPLRVRAGVRGSTALESPPSRVRVRVRVRVRARVGVRVKG